MGLNRIYDPAKSTELSSSQYEFKHQLVLAASRGSFRVKATGLDSQGRLVAGAKQAVSIDMVAP